LVPTRTFAPPPPEELNSVHVRAGEYRTEDAAKVLDRTGPTQEIIATWKQHAVGRLTIGFGCTVEHCQHLAEACRQAGIASESIDGEMDEVQRSRILADLRARKLQIVWNVALLTEGFDLPDLSCLIEARPTKSRSLWRQMCGRIMRPAPGKRDGLILDHAANGHRFGVPDQADIYSLNEEKDTKGSRVVRPPVLICPKCSLVMLKPFPEQCPTCRTALQESINERGMATERRELEMRELTPADEADRYQWYQVHVEIARHRNKKLGWVFYRYQDRWCEKPPPWMPVKAGIYEDLYHRPAPDRLRAIANHKGNPVGELV
jgi:superfamily II DNA or RNA helicase